MERESGSSTPSGKEFERYSPTRRFETESKADDTRRKTKDKSDDPRKLSWKKHDPSYDISTEENEPRRKSLSASIRRAFATARASDQRKPKDPIDWTAGETYRRQSSIRPSATNIKIAVRKLPRLLWNVFFWLGRDDEEDIPEIILELREFVIHLIHLSIVWLIFGVIDYTHHYAAIILSDVITKTDFDTPFSEEHITFNRVRTVHDIWGFIHDVLLPVLFYTRNTPESDGNSYVLTSSILMGAPQIRQIRVKNTACIIHPIFEGVYETCYDYYSLENEDKEPFGSKTTGWKYTSNKDVGINYGHISSYGSSGYVVNLTMDIEFTKKWLYELELNGWIRLGTRAVIITFTTASQHVYNVVDLVFELLPTGGVLTSSSFRNHRFNRFTNRWSFFMLSCELCLFCFAIYFTVNLFKCLISRKSSIINVWNIVNANIILLSFVVIFLEGYYLASYSSRYHILVSKIHTSESVVFNELLRHKVAFKSCGALLLCFTVLKTFKFSSLTKPTRLVVSAFSKVKYELLTTVVAAVSVTMGFAVLGVTVFGYGVQTLRTPWDAFFSLLLLSVSNLGYYKECIYLSRIGTYIFFPVYIALVFLFFLNTCVALVVIGFLEATEEIEGDPSRLYLGDVVEETVLLILPNLKLEDLSERLKDALKTKRNEIEYDSFVRILLRYDWSSVEIRLFMKFHGLDRGQKLSFEQMSKAYDDFWIRNLLRLEVDGHNKIKESIEKIEINLDYLETTLSDAKKNAEAVTDKTIHQKSRSTFFRQQ